RVLDLFAGAGTLGIEALSRGAAHVTFVERSREAIAALRTNLSATRFEAQSEVVPISVVAFLERPLAQPYDVVFCDPPFADVEVLGTVLARLPGANALHEGATVVAR